MLSTKKKPKKTELSGDVPKSTPAERKSTPQTCTTDQEPLVLDRQEFSLDLSDHEDDVKQFARSRWEYREQERHEHEQEGYKLAITKARKAQQKRSARGRRLKNEGTFVPLVDTSTYVDWRNMNAHLFENAKTPLERKLRNTIDSIGSNFYPSPVEEERVQNLLAATPYDCGDIAAIAMHMITYVTALTCADNWSQTAAASLQMISACMGTYHASQKLMELVQSATREPLYNESFETFANNIYKVKADLMNLSAVPFYAQLSRMFVLGALFGVLPKRVGTEGVIQQAYNKWCDELEDRARQENVIELILDTLAFASEFIASCYNGTVGKLLRPRGALEKAMWLKSLRIQFSNGALNEFGTTEAGYAEDIANCIVSLRLERKGASYMVRNIYDRYLDEMMRIQNEVHASVALTKKRVPPPIFILYGGSQIGKSAIMYEVASYLGKRFNFPVENRNIWYPQKGDEYDSGYTGNTTVIIDDDIAAEKPDKASVKECFNFLRYNNVIPYQTVQADIEKKGVIGFTHKLALGSTNVYHLNLHHHMQTPEAGFNRATFYEVAVKPEFLDSSGRVDYNRHDYFPYHIYTFSRYRVFKSGTGVEREFIKRDMTYREFLLDIGSMYEGLTVRGAKYLRQIEESSSYPICQSCSLPVDPRGLLCNCRRPVMENEAMDEILGDIATNTFAVVSTITSFVPSPMPLINTYIYPQVFQAVLSGISNIITDYGGSCMISCVWFLLRFLRKDALLSFWVILGLLPHWLWIVAPHGQLIIFKIWLFIWYFLSWLFLLRIKQHVGRILARNLTERSTTTQLILNLGAAGMSFTAAYAAISAARAAARIVFNQGNLDPRNNDEIQKRNDEPNPWLPVVVTNYDRASTPLSNMKPKHVFDKVAANVVFLESFTKKGTLARTNALMIKSNVIAIPYHTWIHIDVSKPSTIIRGPISVGAKITDIYLSGGVRMVEEDMEDDVWSRHDLIFATMSKCCSFIDIIKYFAPEPLKGSRACWMASRDINGNIEERSLVWTWENVVANQASQMPGSYYICNERTMPGMCGSPIILKSNPSYIVGYHCGGSAPTSMPMGAGFAIDRTMVEATLKLMRQKRLLSEGYIAPSIVSAPAVLDNQFKPLDIIPTYHERDCINFVSPDLVNAVVVPRGSCPNMRFKRYSEVVISPLSEALEKQGLPNKWGKPKFNVNRNHAVAFQTLLDPIKGLPEVELGYAIADYINPIIAKFREFGLTAVPLTLDQTVNGDPARKYVRRMNMDTSPGLNLASPKTKHFEVVEVLPRMIYKPKDYVMEEYERVERMVMAGDNPGHIFSSALKDEPTPVVKDKVRVFQVSPLTLVMLVRRYALPIIQHLYSFPLLVEMSQGVSCLNDEWDQLGKFVSSKCAEQCLEGDYSGYDLRQSGQMIRGVGYILSRLAMTLGYSPSQAAVLEILCNEISLKNYLFNGTLFCVDGSNPSGVPITIVINGMINALLHRIVWRRLWLQNEWFKSVGDFRTHVALATVGDDSVASTTKRWFNMRNIQTVMKQLNMPYTDGHKNAIARDFFHFNEIQFCKRKWRFDERLGRYVAPIALDSIFKSLHCYMKSKTYWEDIVIQNVDGALRELSRHDFETFELYASKIRLALESLDMGHMIRNLYLTYDEWYELLKEDYVSPGTDSLLVSLDECRVKQAQSVLITDEGWCEPSHACTLDSTSWLQQTDALTATQNKYCISKNTNEIISSSVGGTRIKNVNFNDSTITWHTAVPVNRDPTFDAAITGDKIQDFLQRPVKVANFEWEIGTAVNKSLDCWTAFFEDARVFERLKYFRHVRADMHVRIVVNGNPFYSGMLIAAYAPLLVNDNRLNVNNITQLSQLPHSLLMPTYSTGATMEFPFVFYNNTFVIPDKEWRAMGRLLIRSVVPLAHANGSTDSITVTVYAAATNVSLTTPTGVVPTVPANTISILNEGDEYGKPSSIAHSVANFAGSLYKVPYIGPYARATEMIATGLGNMAALFGFSRPRQVPEARSVRLRFQHNLAVTNVEDNVASLALDAKKEVTIDPRVVGLNGEDEMAIVPIAMRPSWLATYPVEPEFVPGKHIVSIKCTPIHGVISTTDTYSITPSCFVSLPFRFWKGSTKIRAVIVASAYHKGRLRFVWDPEFNKTNMGEVYNTNYSTVIDISETTDVTLDIGWGRNTTYLMQGGLGSIPNFSALEYTARDPFCNGTLSIYVVNPITSPGATPTGIKIVLFQSMCEDFEVACPDSAIFGKIALVNNVTPPMNPADPAPVAPTNPQPPPPPSTSTDYTTTPTNIPMNPGGGTLAFSANTNVGRPMIGFGAAKGEMSVVGNEMILDLPYVVDRVGAEVTFTLGGTLAGAYPTTYIGYKYSFPEINIPDKLSSYFAVVTPVGSQTYLSKFKFVTPDKFGWVRLKIQTEPSVKFFSIMQTNTAIGTIEVQPSAATVAVLGSGGTTANVTTDGGGYILYNMTFKSTTDIVKVTPAVQTVANKSFTLYATYGGEGGRIYGCYLLFDDNSVSYTVQCTSYLGSYTNHFPTMCWSWHDISSKVGKKITAFCFTSVGTGTTTVAMNLSCLTWWKNTTISSLVYDSVPEILNESDEVPAPPVNTSTDETMGPSAPLAHANQVHFGEQVTSIRQVIKRYVVKATTRNKTLNTVFSEIAPSTGIPLIQKGLHIMDYFKAGFLGARGAIRIKLMCAPVTDRVIGEARISRVSYDALRTNTYLDALKSISWDGTSWEPLTHTCTVDAEIPYYSLLRFFPARMNSTDIPSDYESLRTGIDKLWYGVSVNTLTEVDITIAQAAGEDYSLFFFLTAPQLRVIST